MKKKFQVNEMLKSLLLVQEERITFDGNPLSHGSGFSKLFETEQKLVVKVNSKAQVTLFL